MATGGGQPPPPAPRRAPSPTPSDASDASSDGAGLLDCVLCLKLLHEPVTVACGHSFCRACLARAVDHTEACPLCRAPIHLGNVATHPVSLSLAAAVGALHPRRAAARAASAAAAAAAATVDGAGSITSLPLFLLPVTVFPGGACPLNVFEPRYRLMVRRVLAGSRRFGLLHPPRRSFFGSVAPRAAAADGGDGAAGAAPPPARERAAAPPPPVSANPVVPPSPADVGSVLEITHVSTHADGRYTIQTTCRGRFRVLDRCELDGYVVGRVQALTDEPEVEAAAADADGGDAAGGDATASEPSTAAGGAAGAAAPPAASAASGDAAGGDAAGGDADTPAAEAAPSTPTAGVATPAAAKPPTPPAGGTAGAAGASSSAPAVAAAAAAAGV